MTLANASAALKKYFGYDSFRPLQADIIQTVYDKRDALVLMPTGGGKSICYQIPAVTLEGVAVIVSPLIALMKDQVEGLSANGIPAAFINSTLTSEQARNVENALLAGYVKLLYVSPEKLVSQGFQPLLKRLKISLFAIDEALHLGMGTRFQAGIHAVAIFERAISRHPNPRAHRYCRQTDPQGHRGTTSPA